jgi:hypothetical protein
MKSLKLVILSLLTITILLTGSLVNASDNRLTKDEFLQRVLNGLLILDRDPALAYNPNILQKMVDKQRKYYPDLSVDNFYVYEIRDNNFNYQLFWEFYSGLCKLRIEELDKTTNKPNVKTIDIEGQKVDKKYCDKVYGKVL